MGAGDNLQVAALVLLGLDGITSAGHCPAAPATPALPWLQDGGMGSLCSEPLTAQGAV